MATLNLARLESELRTFRRQKRLQYSSIFPVVWQPLAKDASLAEGALISLLGQTASDWYVNTFPDTYFKRFEIAVS